MAADDTTFKDTKKVEESVTSEEVSEEVVAAPAYPDGGFWAWSTVIGAFLVQYSTFGYINAFGVYQDYYVRVYLTHSSPSDIGWIGGIQIFFNFGLGVIAGRLFDRGYFRYLMTSSILLHAVALFMLSLSHENRYYQVFLTNGVALGLACGITYVPSLGIVSHYFHRRRSLAIGIVSSGSALGAILHPIMLNHLFNGRIGFHNGVRISAALNVVLLIIAFAMMRTRLPPKPVQHFPIGQWILEPAYGFSLLACVFTFLGLFFPVFYLQLDAISHGVDRQFAFYSISILNAASVVGRMMPNAIAPTFGICNLLATFTFITGVVTLTMPAVHTLAGTILFGVFWGFSSGAVIALVPALVGLLAKDMSEVGTRLGIFFGIGSILGLFATPIAGALLTKQYHWLHASLFAGITMLVAAGLQVKIRYILAQRKGTQII
ncbi:hypothetical protein D9611_001313 [Ephemerocybe angulata]|uniref:Major facilitator superfamily (MFS) profile domain-containing protein n=1 Tax=Ephemerocybe angulata TaxID=980116 RepID=A0A8H5CHT5_9AGAR|nr:hypothetical protein D9611_001313 [Tulosesus angulatus]